MLIDSATAAAPGTRAASDQAEMEEDLTNFLQLLTTQLQNQDPLEPMNANEFTQQLVQFASVEQQIQQNANLESLIDLAATNQVGAMASFIGKAVDYNGDQLPLLDGHAKGTYTLAQPANDVLVEVIDSSGKTVYSESGKDTAGSHAFAWDGRDDAGNAVADDVYTLSVTATDAQGAPVDVSTTVSAIVDTVQSVDGRLVLNAGGASIDLDQVIGIGGGQSTLAEQSAEPVDEADDSLF